MPPGSAERYAGAPFKNIRGMFFCRAEKRLAAQWPPVLIDAGAPAAEASRRKGSLVTNGNHCAVRAFGVLFCPGGAFSCCIGDNAGCCRNTADPEGAPLRCQYTGSPHQGGARGRKGTRRRARTAKVGSLSLPCTAKNALSGLAVCPALPLAYGRKVCGRRQ